MLSLRLLCLSHILLLALSNVLVQYPFSIFGFHTTWGAFSYPCIFILTDLTARIFGAKEARSLVFRSMPPSFFLSYFLTCMLTGHQEMSAFFTVSILPLRIAFACLLAYSMGQLLDIYVFQAYRSKGAWWLAPSLSGTLGTTLDTFIFFFFAFYGCSDVFLSLHWFDIALVDWMFKLFFGLVGVPIYGVFMQMFFIKKQTFA